MTAALEVQVCAGPGEGQRVRIADGQTVTFGRVFGFSEVWLSDKLLAPLHFELGFRAGQCKLVDRSVGVQKHPHCRNACYLSALRNATCPAMLCRLFDMSATNGVYVNGALQRQMILRDGDMIAAGSSAFRVRMGANLEADSKVSSRVSASPRLSPSQKNNAVAALSKSGTPLYGVLDAARDPLITDLLHTHDDLFYSLYEGAGEEVEAVGPFLVAFRRDSPLLRTLLDHWGDSWGVLFNAGIDFIGMRKHLRKFLRVASESKVNLYFRFYDPRVLRTFLPSCAPSELSHFFGPIHRFVFESGRTTGLTSCSLRDSKLSIERVPL